MPVDKFGRMSDAKTKDTGVSLTFVFDKDKYLAVGEVSMGG